VKKVSSLNFIEKSIGVSAGFALQTVLSSLQMKSSP